VTQILSGKLDRDLTLEQKIDGGLIAGIVITVESYVIDASFRWKIKERAKELIKEI
jgi:F0F1-type ATP synthase delta subunit